MLKSMTGYGRAIELRNGREITVEVKSVNHRYFDFSARVPKAYGFLEERLKKRASNYLSRGKVEVYVSIVTVEGTPYKISVNEPVARGYLRAADTLAALGIPNDLTVSRLMGLSDVLTLEKEDEDLEALWTDVSAVADIAFGAFVEMRSAEGMRMAEDISDRLKFIENASFEIDRFSEQNVTEYAQRLENKIRELLADRELEESRLLTEVAIFADKAAVAEETVRLRSHIAQLREFLASEVPVGRKMDFLIQELNREINTVGSKSNDIPIARTVVGVKSEIEKILEQVQNIERRSGYEIN